MDDRENVKIIPGIPRGKSMAGKSKRLLSKTIIPNSLLVFFSIIFIFPFLWLVSNSLKTSAEIFETISFSTFLPEKPQWHNYVDIFKTMPFLTYLKNSLILSLIPVAGQLIGSSLTAYSLARIPWKGSKLVFTGLLATMILPYQVTMIPIYIMMAKIKWTGTYLPLTALAFLGYPYFIFMLRQFFKTIPVEISESARIDGAGEFRIYFGIILPLAASALAAVGIVQFQWAWNDFQGPLIYLNKSSMWSLALGLTNFMQMHKTDWERLMAACTIFIIPMILTFAVGQKYFIKGIATTGFK